jgi:hypothetical protein
MQGDSEMPIPTMTPEDSAAQALVFKRLIESIRNNPDADMKVDRGGKVSLGIYPPEVMAASLGAQGEAGKQTAAKVGPTTLAGIMSPEVMKMIAGMQEQGNVRADQLPQALAQMDYQGALAGQARGWEERMMREEVSKIYDRLKANEGRLADQRLANAGALAVRREAPRESESVKALNTARTGYLTNLGNAAVTRAGAETPAQINLRKAEKNNSAKLEMLIDKEDSGWKGLIPTFNNTQGFSGHNWGYANDSGYLNDNPVRVQFGENTLGQVRNLAIMLNEVPSDFINKLYKDSVKYKVLPSKLLEEMFLKVEKELGVPEKPEVPAGLEDAPVGADNAY